MIAVKLDFDSKEFIKFTYELDPAAIQRAIGRAVRKTAAWVRTHLTRNVKNEMDLPRKIIAYRVQQYSKAFRQGIEGGKAVKVWFGIDPLKADRIDTPKKMSKGYRVKKWEFKQGFMPPSRAGKLYERTTKNRLPIKRATVEINEAGNKAFAEIANQVPAKMEQMALAELRYEVFRATGK